MASGAAGAETMRAACDTANLARASGESIAASISGHSLAGAVATKAGVDSHGRAR
jgi:hypothetical protein